MKIVYQHFYGNKRDTGLDATITFNLDGSITTSGYHGESPTLLRHLDPTWWEYIHARISSSDARRIFTGKLLVSDYIIHAIAGLGKDEWRQVITQ